MVDPSVSSSCSLTTLVNKLWAPVLRLWGAGGVVYLKSYWEQRLATVIRFSMVPSLDHKMLVKSAH